MINIIGFKESSVTNDALNIANRLSLNAQILSAEDFLNNKFNNQDQFITTVTLDLDLRDQIINKLDADNLTRASIVDKSCYVDPSAQIAGGTLIGPFGLIAYQAVLGKVSCVGPYSMITHRAQVGNNCIIHSGTMIAGSTIIGNNCHFNFRSSVIDKLSICDNVTLGAGSMVTKNIDVPGRYVGTPARKIG